MDIYMNETEQLIEFIRKSPTSFHVVKNISTILDEAGAYRLYENKPWKLEKGKMYYVLRNDSSVISFRIPENVASKFHIIASHCDSPSFKIKEKPEMIKGDHYVELNVEKYGGINLSTWFDRPLSIAGRVVVSKEGRIESRLIDFDSDICMIPSLAIHLNREVNDGVKIDVQKNMIPIWGDESNRDTFMKEVAKLSGVQEEYIVGSDLYLYNREKAVVWGAKKEYFSAARIDDLMCVYPSVKAFVLAQNDESVNVCAVFDNEEVGSTSKQGADSSFLGDVLERIADALGKTREEYHIMIADSFMISADNGHALHPNYMEKSDPTNQPYLNGGVVIKYNASQKYTTDAVSAATIKKLCKYADVPFQTYANNSNIAGGSTLGNIANTHVSMNTADIGSAQLAMHSAYETAGVKDVLYLRKMMEVFYKEIYEKIISI